MKKEQNNGNKKIYLCLAAVVVLLILAGLIANGLRRQTNVDPGNTTDPVDTTVPVSTPAPTVTTAPPATVTTAPPPTEPENTAIVVVAQTWRPFLEDATEFGEVNFNEVDAYHLLKCEFEGTNAVYGGLSSSLYWGIQFAPQLLEQNLRNADVTYDVRVNYGALSHLVETGNWKDSYTVDDGQHGVYPTDQTFSWKGHDLWGMTTDELGLPDVLVQVGGVWVDIVVKVDDNIVGCAVFEIVPYQNFGLTARYVCSEYYPQVNGRYQNITEEFVQKRLEACHQA